MRLDHIAYRVADRDKTAKFFINFFGYQKQTEFTIPFKDGSTANCIALTPGEKSQTANFPWTHTVLGETRGVCGDGLCPEASQEYHLAPEIFVSEGSPDSVVGKWVAQRDGIGGIHHIAYQVSDVRAAMEKMAVYGCGFTSEDVLVCPDDELHQIFTKPHPLTGVIYEFIKRGEFGFCQANVEGLMESTKGLK